MYYKIGIVLPQGKPILIETDCADTYLTTLKQLRTKNAQVELEQDGMTVSIRTNNISKLVYRCEEHDFDLRGDL